MLATVHIDGVHATRAYAVKLAALHT